MKAYAIRDRLTGECYAKRHTKTGWYTSDMTVVRIYSSPEAAQRVIASGNHHVSYPGNRDLEVYVLSIV